MPPRCPKCNKPLETVKEIGEKRREYRYNPKKGEYFETKSSSSLEIVCPECGADITDLFPDGTLGYRSYGFLLKRRPYQPIIVTDPKTSKVVFKLTDKEATLLEYILYVGGTIEEEEIMLRETGLTRRTEKRLEKKGLIRLERLDEEILWIRVNYEKLAEITEYKERGYHFTGLIE